MICVFPADAEDFTGNGAGMLAPTKCEVSETLNGEYELVMEHPLDDGHKWQRLQEGRILRVPVPAAASMGASFWPSPKAITSSRDRPRCSARRSRDLPLSTPSGAIST